MAPPTDERDDNSHVIILSGSAHIATPTGTPTTIRPARRARHVASTPTDTRLQSAIPLSCLPPAVAVGTALAGGPRADPSVRNYRTGLLARVKRRTGLLRGGT